MLFFFSLLIFLNYIFMFCSSTCVTILLHSLVYVNWYSWSEHIYFKNTICQYMLHQICKPKNRSVINSSPFPLPPIFLKINIVNAVFLFRSFWLIFQNKALAVCFEASSCQISPFMTHRFQNRYSRIDCVTNHSTDAEPRRIFLKRETSEWRGKIARREILIAWFIQLIRQ